MFELKRSLDAKVGFNDCMTTLYSPAGSQPGSDIVFPNIRFMLHLGIS